jgi:hypothetical protein
VRPGFEELESRWLPSTVGTPNQNFVDQVFQDLLHRPADSVGLATLSNKLDSGMMNRFQVVFSVENSAEGRSTLVNDLFFRFLHRSADPQALLFGTNFLAQGNSTVALEARIIGSPEYLQTRAGGVDQFFLAALYNDVLDRAVDAAAQATDTQALAQGVSPAQIALDVLTSTEGRADQVRGYYTSYLRRPADPAGLGFWTNTLQELGSGQQSINANPPPSSQNPDMAVVAEFLSSAEYYQKAQTPLGLASVPGPA